MPVAGFDQQLRLGRAYEHDLVLLLRSKNYWVTPTGDIANGGAPRILGPHGRALVLPDVEAYRNAKCYPFELKTKSIPTPTRKLGGRLEHGFSYRHYQHYREYERVTGHCLIIVVREQQSGELLARPLRSLPEPRIYDGGKMGPSGMVFFPRDAFRVFHQGPPSDLPLFQHMDVAVPPTLPPFEEDAPMIARRTLKPPPSLQDLVAHGAATTKFLSTPGSNMIAI
jgi:hypothetical protein